MKSLLLTLTTAAVTALVVQPGIAQTFAPGPYYAMPAWDQTLPCTSSTNCPRFVVLSNMDNAAVLDRETGLVWERSPYQHTFRLIDAANTCRTIKKIGNRYGWRLPSVDQLATLVDASRSSPPALPAGHPFVMKTDWYWTASSDSDPDFPNHVYVVGFGGIGGGVVTENYTVAQRLVWCVRGGQGVDLPER
jgi:hypothetical protein